MSNSPVFININTFPVFVDEELLTDWFPANVNPVHVGVYRVSTRDRYLTGWSYSFWNGKSWESFKDWHTYHRYAPDMLWRGLNRRLDNINGLTF